MGRISCYLRHRVERESRLLRTNFASSRGQSMGKVTLAVTLLLICFIVLKCFQPDTTKIFFPKVTSEVALDEVDYCNTTFACSDLSAYNSIMNFLDIPLEVAFKLITVSIRQQFFMLKPSYYNSWGNPYLSSKFLNTHLCTIRIVRYKSLPLGTINQYI